jgi:large subunit ribosomal protein L6
MSRNGKIPVAIPEKVKASVADCRVSIEGPKGKLVKQFDKSIEIVLENNAFSVRPVKDSRLARAMHGTARSIISSMVEGVVKGYNKKLEIHGVGFRASLNGKVLGLNLGYSHDIKYEIPEGIIVTVTENTKLSVDGPDKHMVGQVAADIKSYFPVEPYKGKGVRIVGEYVRRKEGKKTS